MVVKFEHLPWKSPGKLVTLDFIIFLRIFCNFLALATKNIYPLYCPNVVWLPLKLFFCPGKSPGKAMEFWHSQLVRTLYIVPGLLSDIFRYFHFLTLFNALFYVYITCRFWYGILHFLVLKKYGKVWILMCP